MYDGKTSSNAVHFVPFFSFGIYLSTTHVLHDCLIEQAISIIYMANCGVYSMPISIFHIHCLVMKISVLNGKIISYL
jgi:hypothetical protein